MKLIPLSRPDVSDGDVDRVVRVLRSGRLVQGELVECFERALSQRCGRAHAVAVSSGTAALQLAMQVLGVGAGDEVICPDLTWPSPAHAALLSGATPVLVDVHSKEWNLLPELAARAITARTAAIIAIDQFGAPARHQELLEVAKHIPVIEDAACALGSSLNGKPCGNFGTIACLSFHPRKVVTTGEGGMCLTDDPKLAARLQSLRNHGQSEPGQFATVSGNYRMTEMAAALGLGQLGRLQETQTRRAAIASRYAEAIPQLQWQQPPPRGSVNHQTAGALLPEGYDNDARGRFIEALRRRSVQAGVLSYALHTLATMQERAHHASSFDNSKQIHVRGLALPLHSGMAEEQVEHVIGATFECLDECSRVRG